MKTDTLLLFQSALITLQMINASIGTITHDATICLIVGAVVGGFQFYVQRIGNQTEPAPKPQAPPKG